MVNAGGGTSRGYSAVRFSANRRMVAVNSALAAKQHTIHLMTEVDVSAVRRLMAEHKSRTGESLSLTAYVVACLGRAIAEFPSFNSFKKRSRLYLLDDVTISLAIEREVDGESVPQPLPIKAVNAKTFSQVNSELREAQRAYAKAEAPQRGASLMRFIPDALLRAFARLVTADPGVVQQIGVVGVSSVGMFAPDATWLVPLSPTTVMVSVGSIVRRPVLVDGVLEEREALCLTASFNHDIVDGAPAARFMKRFTDILTGADEVRALVTEEVQQ